jgi:hypothetical protein
MRIDVGGELGLAISYDASEKGLLLASPATLQVGDKLSVTFAIAPVEKEERVVTGTVVRIMSNDEDPDGMWPNKIGVEFDEPVPKLEQILRAAKRD